MATENLTTYTEVDPNSRITITSARATYAGLAMNEDAFVYKDFTADHFNGDFEHLIDFKITSADDNGYVYIWGLTNSADDIFDIQSAGGSFLACSAARNGADYLLRILEFDNPNIYFDTYNFTVNTAYYLKIKRDESVGTYGTIYIYIYSDSARTTLVDTLEVALHTSKKDFRYLFALSSRSDGSAYTINGYQENLDIQESTDVVMEVLAGNYTYTGADIGLSKGWTMVVTAGNYIYAGLSVLMNFSGWSHKAKPTTSWTKKTKPTTTWTEKIKPTSSWTYKDKN